MKLNKDKFFTISGKKYAIDFDKLKEVCEVKKGGDGTSEMEISQAYDSSPLGSMNITSKVEHERHITGTQPNEMVVYDIVKVFILYLLDSELTSVNPSDLHTISDVVVFNSLISSGILIEIE